MADVFISYSREDRVRAEQVAQGLQAMGLSCFWDTDIPPGQTWADYIESKLSQCKAVVVLWSEHSTKSQWVREEARMGRDKARLIPVMLDGAQPPFGFGEVQAANLSTWTGDPNHPGWQRFSQAVYNAATPVGGAQPQAAFTPPPPQAPPQHHTSGWTTPQPGPQQHASWSGAQAGAQGGDMSPIGYIQKCLRLYADGKGRARRAEFGWFFLFAFVAGFVAAVIDVATGGVNPYTGMQNSYIFTLIVGLALIAPAVAAASRRAHDFGQSGWLAALTCVPYIGVIAALVFIFIPGQAGPNQHGPNPKGV
ncbi:MAG: TIR domain-containing protein [Hyphomonadaceae bacterium]